ncbi:MAG: NAD-dependent epimerase/dehydratase family protein, partial [Candidatus Kariarchaeaceae archaeon]
ELIKQNISTKILVRDVERYKSLYPDERIPGIVNVIQGDLDTNQALANVLEHVDTIFVCFNAEPQYWEKDVIRWIDRISNLATALEATIVYPGCMINYGPKKDSITEEDVQDGTSELGQLKIAIEQRLYRASLEGAALVLVRFPDLYGPADFHSEIGSVYNSASINKTSSWMGDIEINHEFMFSHDAAKVLVQVATKEKAKDRVFHISGDKVKVSDFISQIYDMAEAMVFPKVKKVAYWKQLILTIVSKKYRYQDQLKYLFENENYFSDDLFTTEIGNIDRTPIKAGIEETINWYKFWNSKN